MRLEGIDPSRLAEMARLLHRVEFLETPLLQFIPRVSPHLVAPLHLAPLIDLLDRAERQPVRALVSTPPRHGKTVALTHAIARYLARNPTKTAGYATYAYHLAKSKSRDIRDIARRAGVVIRDDADSLTEWRTPQGGGVLAGGVGQSWTGVGIDYFVIDDPTRDREAAESRVVREKNYDWLTSTALTRIEPHGSVIINMARWHAEDMIGRLAREQPLAWEVVNLPALSEDGAPLWPERWPAEALAEKRAEIGEYDFASLYQGSPRLRGTTVFKEPARYVQPEIAGRRILIGVDVAATVSTRSDYSVACVMAVKGSGAKMCADVIEVWREQVEIPKLCHELDRLQRKWNCPLIVEAVGVGKAVPQVLREISQKLRITEIHPKSDKFLRAQSLASAWNEGRVRVPGTECPWLRDYLTEMINFTGVRDTFDDAVDATAHVWNYAMSTAPIVPVQLERGPFAKGAHVPTDEWGRRITRSDS